MSIELKIPNVGESIQEVQIGQWLKHEGDRVEHDETIVELETDKASMELPAPISGVISKIVKRDGESVAVGEVIAYLDAEAGGTEATAAAAAQTEAQQPQTETEPRETGPRETASPSTLAQAAGPVKAASKASLEQAAESSAERVDVERQEAQPVASPSVRRMLREHHLKPQDVNPSGEGGRVLRDDVLRYVEKRDEQERPAEEGKRSADDGPAGKALAPRPAAPTSPRPPVARVPQDESERIVPMSLIRRRIAARLVEARQTAALLTTFNEIDMSAVTELRATYRETFQQRHGVKLGFLSFFVKAAVEALRQVPVVNAEVRGTDIVYHDVYHIGIAIGAKRGLIVPVLRNADQLSFAQIEHAIDDFAQRAESNKLEPGELSGGTFTISNGGIYGSLLSTPIVNPPQSGVLGMHAIQQRPVAHEGQVVIRPMMYIALTYDHRIVDGREAVIFLRTVKETVESPARLLIGV
jgi:2-oxoglutarate dehydrogenase E2 component (dihydrolipoamide succinyltransferase)